MIRWLGDARSRAYRRTVRVRGPRLDSTLPVSITTETAATHASPDKAARRGKRKCNSVSSATTSPTNTSHLGSTPLPSATSEVAATIAEAPTW